MTYAKWPGEPLIGSIYGEKEMKAISDALAESLVPNVGFRATDANELFENKIADYCGYEFVIALNGGITGLEIALRLLRKAGEGNILSTALNFHGTHLAILRAGFELVLCDSEEQNFGVDIESLISRLNKDTKAIVLTSLHGQIEDFGMVRHALEVKARKIGIKTPLIIWDAARAFGANIKSIASSDYPWASIFSFQSKKIITTLGEGGAIATNCSDLNLFARQQRSFGLGEAEGTNHKLTKIQALVGCAQIDRMPDLVVRRRKLAKERDKILRSVQGLNISGRKTRQVDSCYFYNLSLKPEAIQIRASLMKYLEETLSVGSTIANPPTYVKNSYLATELMQRLPASELLSTSIFAPSLHPSMGNPLNKLIATTIRDYLQGF